MPADGIGLAHAAIISAWPRLAKPSTTSFAKTSRAGLARSTGAGVTAFSISRRLGPWYGGLEEMML